MIFSRWEAAFFAHVAQGCTDEIAEERADASIAFLDERAERLAHASHVVASGMKPDDHARRWAALSKFKPREAWTPRFDVGDLPAAWTALSDAQRAEVDAGGPWPEAAK
jgi:hypothetical protein